MDRHGGKMDGMNADQFKSRMNSLAYGEAMLAAARDYAQEVKGQENQQNNAQTAEIDIDDLLDDPELERMHAERLAAMQQEAEKRVALQRKGHGELQEVAEGDFLEIVTKAPKCVVHFFHRDFERCKIIDRHLTVLARKYFDTRFIKLSAPDSPFFTVKLKVKMLPAILMFINGVNVDRAVGFEEFGQKDDFPTSAVERKLLSCHVVAPPKKSEDDSDSEVEAEQIRRSVFSGEGRNRTTASDEDSDFD